MKLSVSILCLGIYFLAFSSRTDSACSLPSALNGIWWDSRTNSPITISSKQVTAGWRLAHTDGTHSYDTFTCIESDDRRWIFRSDNVIPVRFGLDYYGFFCLEYTFITTNSYKYYLRSDMVTEFSDERVTIVDTTTSLTYTTVDQYCPNSGPDDRGYNVLVKKDMQSAIHSEHFPDLLLGVFSYTVNDGSSVTCGAGSVLDACFVNNVIDRTILSINFTQCSTPLMGSSSGVLYHVTSVYFGTSYYVTLLNADGQDTLFTCIAVSQTGNDRSVSTNPGSCAENQISTTRTSDANSVLLSMTAYETCLVTTTTSTTTIPTTTNSGDSNDGDSGSPACSTSSGSGNATAIVAVVFSLLLLIAIIIIAYLIYRNMKSKRAKITHRKSSRKSVTEIKKPLPIVSDFTFSEQPKRSKKKSKVEKDMVIEPMTPREEVDNLWNESFRGSLTPITEGTRPPTSTMWTARSDTSDHFAKSGHSNLMKLRDHMSTSDYSSLTKQADHNKPTSGRSSTKLPDHYTATSGRNVTKRPDYNIENHDRFLTKSQYHNMSTPGHNLTKQPDHSKPMSSVLPHLNGPLPPIHKH